MHLLNKTVFIGMAVLWCQSSLGQQANWKYSFMPGDHLTYTETLEREVRGPEVESRTRARFTNHVLIAGAARGALSVGFQRNRQSAELLVYREKGNDRLPQQRHDFDQRMAARPARFAEANELSLAGAALNYWQAARESQSKVLMAVHEIEALPEMPVKLGDTWPGANLLGVTFRFAGVETIGGEPCNRAEGGGSAASLRYWWCPKSGVLARVEFEAEYAVPGDAVVREKARFDLEERHRGEDLRQWMSSPETRQGAFSAVLLSHWVPVDPVLLQLGLRSAESDLQALALAVLYQRKLRFPDTDQLQQLAQNGGVEVKRIAERLLGPPAPDPAPHQHSCPSPPAAHYPPQKPGASLRFLQEGPSKGWPYMLHVPKDYRGDRSFPLLVYLSGGGGQAIDGVNTAEEIVAPSDYLTLYPHANGLWWTPEATAHFAATLEEVLHQLNVDTNRVYITDFSNGGTGAVYYAELWPQRFAAVVSLMGAGVCLREAIPPLLPNLRELPVLEVHGEKDLRIAPVCSQQTHAALEKLAPGTPPELRLLKDREHDITLREDDGLTLKFLQGKVRHAWPRRLSARVSDLARPRQYWLEVVEKTNGVAEIEAQIKPDNTIELSTKNVKRLRLRLQPDLFLTPGALRVVLNKKEVFRGELQVDCAVGQQSAASTHDSSLGYAQILEFAIAK